VEDVPLNVNFALSEPVLGAAAVLIWQILLHRSYYSGIRNY